MKRLLSLILCLALLAVAVPVTASAANLSEQQEALVQTALAFYYKNPYMQYDSVKLTTASRTRGGAVRSNNYIAPEAATSEREVYTVCSSFCFEVYWNALGYKLMGDPVNSDTEKLFDNAPADMVMQRWTRDGDVPIAEALKTSASILQAGDIIVERTVKDTGHAMFYAGDVDGDGKGDIIHSTSTGGGKMDMTTGVDKVEKDGDIQLDCVETFLFSPESSSYLGGRAGYVILRPLAADAAGCEPTATAKARVQHPRLAIERTSSVGFFGSPVSGETMTYSIQIKNHDSKAQSVPVEETVPAGTELVEAKEATVNGTTLRWTADLPAGGTKTLAYTVKVTAKPGEVIENGGGNVGGIPSNTLYHTVSGKVVDAAAVKGYEGKLSQLKSDAADGLSFARSFYKTVLGIDLPLPETSRKFFSAAFVASKKAIGGAELKQTDDPARKMIVRGFLGGLGYVCDDTNDRVLNPDPADLMPGDIVLVGGMSFTDKSTTSYIWTGDKLVTVVNGALKTWASPVTLLQQELFVAIRPSQAYADLQNLPVALPFTDVKQGEWYYDFVSELYGKGIVSGMTATTFVPNGQLTAGQALKLIVVGLGYGEKAPISHWASGYLYFADEQGWLTERPEINLDAPISRLTFCRIAAKAKKLTAQPATNPFKDCADKDVLALVNAGIINGMSADTFAPDTTLTRAQISKIISGLIK